VSSVPFAVANLASACKYLCYFLVMFPQTELIAEKLNYSIFGSNTTKFFRRLVDCIIQRKEQYAKEKVSYILSSSWSVHFDFRNCGF